MKPTIIGIDHGYGNIKTAHCCFPTGLIRHDKKPVFQNDLLFYENKYYTIGEGHKEFLPDKIMDDDFYLLTLAAIARELHLQNKTEANVFIAAGLPLTWVSEQRDSFQAYLTKQSHAEFTFRDVRYRINIIGASVYPQGFGAVVSQIHKFGGLNMLCDIGSGTMNVMYIKDRKPMPDKCFTEKYGTRQCIIACRECLLKRFGSAADESIIDKVLRTGQSDMAPKYFEAIKETAEEYVDGIFRLLREHEYDPNLMHLHIVGGGGCLIQHFGTYDPERVFIQNDLCAAAKGYEFTANHMLKKGRLL